MLERWPQGCRVKITFGLLLPDCFVSTAKNSIKRFANFVMDEPRGQASSANHRQTGLGLHQRGWSNDACATLQRRTHHELAWIWTVFLSAQRRTTDFVETVARRAANDSLHDVCTGLKGVCYSFHDKEVSAPLHRRAGTGACAFLRRVWHAFKRVLLITMHV